MSCTFSMSLAFPAALHRALGAPRTSLVSPVTFVALAVLLATPVTGQTVATNFEELRFKVHAGDTVYHTDDSSNSEQKVRILDLTGSSLSVSIDGVRRDLDESSVKRIRQRFPDSRKNGALIGFLVGAAGSTAAAVTLASPAGSCHGGCVAGNVVFGGGLGALVGLGIAGPEGYLREGLQPILAGYRLPSLPVATREGHQHIASVLRAERPAR